MSRRSSWGQTQPPASAQIDWSNPLTNGIIQFFPFWYGASAPPNSLYGHGSVAGGAYWTAQGIYIPGAGNSLFNADYWQPSNNSGGGGLTQASWVLYANIQSFPAHNVSLLGDLSSNNATGIFTNQSPAGQLVIGWHGSTYPLGPVVPTNKWVIIGGTYDGNTGTATAWNPAGYAKNVDGTNTGPCWNSTQYGTPGSNTILGNYYGPADISGYFQYGLVFDRILLESEFEQLYANPYCFLAPPGPRQRYFATSSSPPIPVSLVGYSSGKTTTLWGTLSSAVAGSLAGTIAASSSEWADMNMLLGASAGGDDASVANLSSSLGGEVSVSSQLRGDTSILLSGSLLTTGNLSGSPHLVLGAVSGAQSTPRGSLGMLIGFDGTASAEGGIYGAMNFITNQLGGIASAASGIYAIYSQVSTLSGVGAGFSRAYASLSISLDGKVAGTGIQYSDLFYPLGGRATANSGAEATLNNSFRGSIVGSTQLDAIPGLDLSGVSAGDTKGVALPLILFGGSSTGSSKNSGTPLISLAGFVDDLGTLSGTTLFALSGGISAGINEIWGDFAAIPGGIPILGGIEGLGSLYGLLTVNIRAVPAFIVITEASTYFLETDERALTSMEETSG